LQKLTDAKHFLLKNLKKISETVALEMSLYTAENVTHKFIIGNKTNICIAILLLFILKILPIIIITVKIIAVVVFLFLAGLWLRRAIINGPDFHPKFTMAVSTISYRRPAASHIDRPSRTLLTVRPAWQDAVLLRRMTTTWSHDYSLVIIIIMR